LDEALRLPAYPAIEIRDLCMSFGGLQALNKIDFYIDRGEIVALIGPNGAGKTTFFNCITGIYKPTIGEILISPEGSPPHSITGFKPNLITRAGVARTFQNIRLFRKMTVIENIMVARHCRTSTGILGAIYRGKRSRAEEAETLSVSRQILQRFNLLQYANAWAGDLPYGEQRRLEIARAIATEPFLLLLDEPAAGLNPKDTEDLNLLITNLRDEKQLSILLIEHDMRFVMRLSERIYVLDHGEKIAEGIPSEIVTNHKVIQAYLGETADA
jgi:branched-chain amino acid transport system ATP-binding protein